LHDSAAKCNKIVN